MPLRTAGGRLLEEFRDGKDVDLAGVAGFGFFLRRAGRGGPMWHRLRVATTMLTSGGQNVVQGMQSHCVTASALAERLGLGPDVVAALRQFFTRWDGHGVPQGVGGTDIAPIVRLLHLADVVEVRYRTGGIDGALEVARARRGRQFAPDVVDAFVAHAPEVLSDAGIDPLKPDPALRRPLTEDELDAALEALADFTDLRCASRAGHSSPGRRRWPGRERSRRPPTSGWTAAATTAACPARPYR